MEIEAIAAHDYSPVLFYENSINGLFFTAVNFN